MKIFAIGDLHLSLDSDKPMDVFGPKWDHHAERIAEWWKEAVSAEDLVLVPGDISWAMHLKNAAADLKYLGDLPGRKVILRGNHDYWWDSLSKVRNALPSSICALQNDALEIGGVAIAGSRGWTCPGSLNFNPEQDLRIYDRELIRLELSLKKAAGKGTLICMLHYPPFNESRAPSGFTELLERYGASIAVYGHLHGKSCKSAFEGAKNGVQYVLCSADYLEFRPKLIMEV